VACTLDLIGDKWTLLVVRDLFAGKTHYHEFTESPEGIATNILAARLQRLCECGLVEAKASQVRVGSRAYELTARGRSLGPVLEALRDWGLANIKGTSARVRVQHP
jgi:DNA-binding HxlR family transcriptional regulator